MTALHIPEEARHLVTPSVEKQLIQFNDLVMEKNEVVNLTGFRDREESLVKNVEDSLTVYRDDCFPEGGRLLDLGTGAGFPGIVLAILRPDMQVVLMDAIRKKLRFIEEAAQTMGLKNITVVHSRAEDAARQKEFRDAFDIVTARAVKSMPVISEWALPFVRPGGVFAAMKGPGAEEELKQAGQALKLLHGKVMDTRNLALSSGDSRTILYIRKCGETPRRFPRKPGEAERKPLK
jgi:16S rRNA (guanine527-N7)-methyltransferase